MAEVLWKGGAVNKWQSRKVVGVDDPAGSLRS